MAPSPMSTPCRPSKAAGAGAGVSAVESAGSASFLGGASIAPTSTAAASSEGGGTSVGLTAGSVDVLCSLRLRAAACTRRRRGGAGEGSHGHAWRLRLAARAERTPTQRTWRPTTRKARQAAHRSRGRAGGIALALLLPELLAAGMPKYWCHCAEAALKSGRTTKHVFVTSSTGACGVPGAPVDRHFFHVPSAVEFLVALHGADDREDLLVGRLPHLLFGAGGMNARRRRSTQVPTGLAPPALPCAAFPLPVSTAFIHQ